MFYLIKETLSPVGEAEWISLFAGVRDDKKPDGRGRRKRSRKGGAYTEPAPEESPATAPGTAGREAMPQYVAVLTLDEY